MKKLFVLFLVVCALPALVGCFGGSNDSVAGYNSNPIAATVNADEGTVSVNPAVLEGASNPSDIKVFGKNGVLTTIPVSEVKDGYDSETGTLKIDSDLKADLINKGAKSASIEITDKNGNKQVITAGL